MRVELLSLLLLSFSNPAMAKDAAASISTTATASTAIAPDISFSAVGLPPGLSISPSTGVITGVIDRAALRGQPGPFNVIVRVRTNDGGSGESQLHISLKNNAPVAQEDTVIVLDRTQSVLVDVLANDSDPDGDPLTITSATAAHGTVVKYNKNGIGYLANPNCHGTDAIRYSVSDGMGGSASAIVHITVKAGH
jgi:Bacterial Ig domain